MKMTPLICFFGDKSVWKNAFLLEFKLTLNQIYLQIVLLFLNIF